MYTDADFCNYIQQAAGEQLLSAKAFAYCFIAADEEERQKRLGFLQAAACGDPHPADSSMPGKGLDPALFEQARARWESEWKADPLVVTIRHKLDEGGGRWQTGGMGIVEACRQLCGEGPATGQEAASLLKELAPRLKERDGIAWHCRTTGTSGRRLHLFARTDAANATIPTIPTK